MPVVRNQTLYLQMELSVAFLDCSPRHLHISKPLLTKWSYQWTLIMVTIICSRTRPAEAVPTDLGWGPPEVQNISLPLAPAGSVWPWPSSGPTLCCCAPCNYCLGLCSSERLQKCLSQAAEMAFFFFCSVRVRWWDCSKARGSLEVSAGCGEQSRWCSLHTPISERKYHFLVCSRSVELTSVCDQGPDLEDKAFSRVSIVSSTR